jgi:hypothetical protein
MRDQQPASNRSWRVARFPVAPVLAAAVILTTAGVGSAASAWNIVTSPNTGSFDGSRAVSCLNSTDCMAVGSNDGGGQTLVENWNGHGWTILPGPTQTGILAAVSCTSPTSCMAVGYGQLGSGPVLAERWDGTTWSISPTPTGVDGQLNSVSCTSSTNCMGVGWLYPDGSLIQSTLAEHWNGSTWSIVATPNQGTSYNVLNSVSCTSSTMCVAVGEGPVGGATLVETWNGSTWALTPSPNPSTSQYILLNGVSCSSSTWCIAVGQYDNYSSGSDVTQTLVMKFDGSTWSIASGPNVGGGGTVFNAVSCTSSTQCVAVGYSGGDFYTSVTLVAAWNGTTWTIAPTVQYPGSQLWAVSCTGRSSCMAAGFWESGDNDSQALVESWNGGTWTAVPYLNPGPLDNLAAVSCASAQNCAAVGGYKPAPTNTGFQPAEAPLIETWNGTSWATLYGQTEGGGAASLNAVSCVGSTECVGVGSDANPSGVPQTLIDTWSTGALYGAKASSPNRGNESVLTGVSCASSTNCDAVGYYLTSSGTERTLIESWDGTSWSLAVSPNKTTEGNELNSVSCTSASSCVAVGKYGYGPDDTGLAMAESWDGSAWSIMAMPERGTQSTFNGVSCTRSTSCVAVGDDNAAGGTLIESWNGSVWSVISHPNGGTLNGVSCSSSSSCVAVGVSGTSQTQVETWNGTRWVSTASANETDWNNEVFGVSCTSATSCTAAGDLVGAGESQTLIETGPA